MARGVGPELLLALDVGTTAVKAGLFGIDGTEHSIVSFEYALLKPRPNIVELDPEIYWQTAVAAIRAAVSRAQIEPERIAAIATCSQGETIICVDKEGKPLRNAIVWMDTRAAEQAMRIDREIGRFAETGQIDVDASWPASKMLWLRENEPEVFSRTHRFLLVDDFITFRLTGRYVGTHASYSSSYLLDVYNKRWIVPVLEYLQIDPARLVDVVGSGQTVGELTQAAAAETGLDRSIVVVTGAMDLAAALVGSGNIEPGMVTEINGGAQIICNTIDKPLTIRSGSMAVQCHAVPDAYLMIGWCPSGGMSLRWFRDTFFPESNFASLIGLADKVAPGSDGLKFFPYQGGPGTLPLSPAVRGGWHGLELSHTRGHFIRSILEALCYLDRQNLDEMRARGFAYREIRAIGGGATSESWNRIRASVFAERVTTMQCSESALLGVAILQAVAIGAHATIAEAVANMVRRRETVTPKESEQERYTALYREYLEVQNTLFAGQSSG